MKMTEILDRNKQFLDALMAVGSLDEKEVISKQLYLFTKEMLDHHANNPAIKRIILDNYIYLWGNAGCLLDIKNTDYADECAGKQFGDLQHDYTPVSVMTAGFDLSGVDFTDFNESDMIFISVKFANANFNAAKFTYSHFEECNLQEVKTNKTNNTNLNQCRFMRCDLTGMRLDSVQFSETYFQNSILVGTEISNRLRRDYRAVNCAIYINDLNYDGLLKQGQAKNGKTTVESNAGEVENLDSNISDVDDGYRRNTFI